VPARQLTAAAPPNVSSSSKPSSGSGSVAPRSVGDSAAFYELLNEEMQAEAAGSLGADQSPAHLEANAAALRREAAETEDEAHELRARYTRQLRMQVLTLEGSAERWRLQADELDSQALKIREEINGGL